MKQLRELEHSPDIQIQIGKKVNEFVQNRQKWSPNSIIKGKRFIDSLGSNGSITVANKIEQMLAIRGL